jgi:hypothetical protein
MQTALPPLIRLGRVVIIPLIGQVVLVQISLHVRVGEIENRADLERANIGIMRNNIQPRPARILRFAQGGQPDFGREFLHAALERLQLEAGAEFLERRLVVGRGRRPMQGLMLRRRNLRRIGVQVEFQLFPQFRRVPAGRWPVESVIACPLVPATNSFFQS